MKVTIYSNDSWERVAEFNNKIYDNFSGMGLDKTHDFEIVIESRTKDVIFSHVITDSETIINLAVMEGRQQSQMDVIKKIK